MSSARNTHGFARQCFSAALLTSALAALAACDNSRYDAERPFFKQSAAEQRTQFRAATPERQVRLYVAAQVEKLSEVALCEELRSASGPAGLPAVMQALADEKDDEAKRALLDALVCVQPAQPRVCDPRLAPIAMSVAKSIVDKDARDEAVNTARELECSPSP